jgi:thiamine biosynthesis protein ThiS
MEIHINGETRTLDVAVTLAELLARLRIDRTKVAVELNCSIVPA